MTPAVVSDDRELVAAILENRMSAWARSVLDDPAADQQARELASRALATCTTIRESAESEGRQIVTALRSSGVESTMSASDQRHSIVIDITAADVDTATMVLKGAGFDAGREWSGAAARSSRRFADGSTFTRSAGHSFVVRLRWRQPERRRSKLRSVVLRAITPTPADWAMVDLPAPLWWAYGALRPFRLVAERLGLVSDDHGDLEPFLVTPDALLDPLFDVAGVDRSDVFADIGCGDGRIVVAAAQRRGCRAIGVEQSSQSVEVAHRHVAADRLTDRIRIIHGDAREVDLSEATVALFFVPMVVAVRIVPTVLEAMASGGRVVLHEQSRPSNDLPRPDRSVAIIADEAVTVAHRWTGRRIRTAGSPDSAPAR